MGVGFIRDKLEIKFLILYIAARVSEPLPLDREAKLHDLNVITTEGGNRQHPDSSWTAFS